MKQDVINEFKKWLKEEKLSLTNTEANFVIAIYIRVSTNKQEELSPISQLKTVYKYAMTHNMQIDLDYIFIEDEGISGRSVEKRDEFQSMIAHAKEKEHPFDTIVVWKFSRFARNQEESIVYKSLLKKNNVNVVSVSENTSDDALGPFGGLIERIIEWMDEYYSINLSTEVMRGMTEGAYKGKYQSIAPFGYRWKDKELVIQEDEAKVVEMIFDKTVKDEMSMIDLARYINQLGFKTKRGSRFENFTIRYILLNPVYKGYTRWTPNGRLTRGELLNNNRSIIVKGSHEAIVSEEIWNTVNEKMNKYANFMRPHQQQTTNPWSWVKGLVRCKNCGRTMIRTNGKLRCNGYNKGCCNVSDSLDVEEVKSLILGEIKQYIDNPINIKIIKQVKKKNTSERDLILNQLAQLDKKEERVKRAYSEGIDSIDEYKTNKIAIKKERQLLQQKLETIVEVKENDEKQEITENLRKVYDILTDDKIEIKKKYDIAHELINEVEYCNNALSLKFNEIR